MTRVAHAARDRNPVTGGDEGCSDENGMQGRPIDLAVDVVREREGVAAPKVVRDGQPEQRVSAFVVTERQVGTNVSDIHEPGERDRQRGDGHRDTDREPRDSGSRACRTCHR